MYKGNQTEQRQYPREAVPKGPLAVISLLLRITIIYMLLNIRMNHTTQKHNLDLCSNNS